MGKSNMTEVTPHLASVSHAFEIAPPVGMDAGPRIADVRSRAGGAPPAMATQFTLKRAVDFSAALVLIVLLAPLMMAIALAIRSTSPGPAIFRSTRQGLGGHQFGCLKFRTMREGAEALQQHLELRNEALGPVFKIARDPRVTKIGRWLRSSGLDELPQLFNVLTGSMSLVGPRPLPLRDCVRLIPAAQRRHSVLPGITGLWQLDPRRHADEFVLVTLDLRYIDHWNVWIDVKVLSGTVLYGMRRVFTINSDLVKGG